MRHSVRTILFGLMVVSFGGVTRGDLVGIEFVDLSRPDADPQTGGPVWRGVVDTAADTLTIHDWYELPGSGPAFWTPYIPDFISGPLVWDAKQVGGANDPLTGVRYDVPDDLGLGGVSIGQDWGFISRISANDMDWVDGNYSVVADYFPGWGAQVPQRLVPGGAPGETEFFLKTAADPGFDPQFESPYDETTLPAWPYTETGFGIRSVLDAEVSVVSLALALTAIPEPSATWPLLLFFSAQAMKPRRS